MHRSISAIFAVTLVATSTLAHSAVLDWNQVDWTQGNETQTFFNVDGTGIDITIALSLSYDWEYQSNRYSNYWSHTDWINDAPNDNNTFGGDGSLQNGESLYLGLNFASDDRYKSYLDVTISFSQAVENTQFSLFDVDSYGYNYTGGFETGIQFIDIIERLEGSYQGTSIAGTTTHDATKILEKTNSDGTYYQGNTAMNDGGRDQDDNPRSTLNLAWSNPVDQISFRYTTGAGAVADPGIQAIALSNISFCNYSAVPEPSTVITAILLPIVGFFAHTRRRRKHCKVA